jgi:ecotropic viral integration site 5 protein
MHVFSPLHIVKGFLFQGAEQDGQATYRVDDFVEDAFALRITPFMLDGYAQEYQEMVRNREAHALEVDGLRSSNRALSAQV